MINIILENKIKNKIINKMEIKYLNNNGKMQKHNGNNLKNYINKIVKKLIILFVKRISN
jgi:hypothetical protein